MFYIFLLENLKTHFLDSGNLNTNTSDVENLRFCTSNIKKKNILDFEN